MREKIIFILILLGASLGSRAQIYVVDTVETNGHKMIIFSDNSYQYLDLLNPDNEYVNINDLYKENVLDTNKLFNTYWNNNVCHVRYKNLYHLKDTLFVNLLEGNKSVLPHTGKITSRFGPRWGKMHKGIDLALKVGQEIKVPFPGKVRYAKYNSGGYGNLIIVRHYNGLETYYAHLDKINVKPNQLIEAGTVIGNGGNTGHSTGAHLHFEIRFMGNAINPEEVFDFVNGKLVLKTLTIVSRLFEYQKNGLKDDIESEDMIFEKDPDKEKEKLLNDSRKGDGKRRKNPDGYTGNM